MTTTTALCACGQPSPDATICRACTDRLAADLAAVPWLREQLDVALSRQTATGRQDGGRSAEKPMPFHLGASDALDLLGRTLLAMVCSVARAGNPVAPDRETLPRRIDDMAAYLVLRLGDVRQRDEAPALARRLGDCIHKGNRTIDLAPDEFFAGPCDGHGVVDGLEAPEHCPGWLYAKADEEGKPERTADCRVCKTTYNAQIRREWMLDAAEDYLAPVAALSRFLTWNGEPLNASTLRTWVQRGRIQQKGTDREGRPMYLVREVRELLTELMVKRLAARSSKGH